MDETAVKEADLEERKERASSYKVDDIPMGTATRSLLDLLRPQLVALGNDVTELCTVRSVTYRVHEFFLEIVPRRGRLLLILNLDYEECDDPSLRMSDATEYAFITHATEKGGALYSFEDPAQIAAAMHLARQAYEKVAE